MLFNSVYKLFQVPCGVFSSSAVEWVYVLFNLCTHMRIHVQNTGSHYSTGQQVAVTCQQRQCRRRLQTSKQECKQSWIKNA